MNKFKKIVIILLSLFALLLIFISTTVLVISTYMRTIATSKQYYDRGLAIVPNADYIVVPGAKIDFNVPSLVLEHRLDYAYMLYSAKKAPKIIVSGGFDEESKKYEASVMGSYLLRLGVPKEAIIFDLNGNSTYDTLKRTKEFVHDKSVIFCTQELYSSRAIYIANKLNLNMIVFCSNPVIYAHRYQDTIRECLACTKAVLNCSIFPSNTFSLREYHFITEVK